MCISPADLCFAASLKVMSDEDFLLAWQGEVTANEESRSSWSKVRQLNYLGKAAYASVLALIEVEAGKYVARHTHRGLEMTYLLEGEATLSVDGRADQPMKAGDWFEVPAGVPHSVRIGDKPGLGHYVIQNDQPVTAWREEPATFEIKG
jgi:quercetin dioxygenase-like cupin family protein